MDVQSFESFQRLLHDDGVVDVPRNSLADNEAAQKAAAVRARNNAAQQRFREKRKLLTQQSNEGDKENEQPVEQGTFKA